MATQRDNVRAGVFVLMGIVLGMGAIVLLTDFKSLVQRRQTVRVYYRLDDGLRGLKPGAAVTLGNVPVGEVTAIADFERGDRVLGQIVTFTIPTRYTLRSDAVVELDVPTLGSGTKLNIRSLGEREPYSPDTVLDGAIATNPLAQDIVANTGIREQERERVRQIIRDVADLTSLLKRDLPEITGGARRVLEKVEPIADQAQQVVADLHQALSDMREMVTAARERSDHWFERIDNITETAQRTLATIDTMVSDADPNVRVAAEQLRTLLEQFNDQTLPRLHAVLDDAGVISAEARAAMVSQRPVIERTMANLQLASGQLKLAMVEVRRSPWRLLYRPDKAEIAHDNLYDAARSFAMGASALESAAASLRAMADGDADDQRIQAIVTYLDAVFARFREAEGTLWRSLDGRVPAP
jgi:ABC-type transporter Mla subunit MlaD